MTIGDDKVRRAQTLDAAGAPKEKIIELLEDASREGSPEARYALGTFYLHGKYLKKDGVRGVSLIKEAAEAGWRDAIFDLAVAYEVGEFLEKNEEKAFQNYMKAMILGDLSAAAAVGRCYYYGIGTSENREVYEDIMDALDEFGEGNTPSQ